MKQFTKWMFAAIILCGTATMFTSCLFEDNPSTPSRPIPEGADSKDYQPSDVSVALLGSLSSYADEEVINYWGSVRLAEQLCRRGGCQILVYGCGAPCDLQDDGGDYQ